MFNLILEGFYEFVLALSAGTRIIQYVLVKSSEPVASL